jgi:hypothetical protein
MTQFEFEKERPEQLTEFRSKLRKLTDEYHAYIYDVNGIAEGIGKIEKAISNQLNQIKTHEVVAALLNMNVDGETMEYILGEVNMKEQMLRQLIMTTPMTVIDDLLDERGIFQD